jgi:hypothetical protein
MMKKGGSLHYIHRCTERRGIFNNSCINSYFHRLMDGGTISLVSNKSAYGTIIKTTISDGSPFVKDTVNHVGEFINTLLCKIVYIGMNEKHIYDGKYSVDIPNFTKEVSTQQEIYYKTGTLGEPVCPSILHAEIFETEKTREFVDILFSFPNMTEIAEKIKHIIETGDIKLGIIFMDYMDGYITLSQYLGNINYIVRKDRIISYLNKVEDLSDPLRSHLKYVYSVCLYQMMRICSIGYKHNDLHYHNIMVKVESGFLKDNEEFPSIRCVIIDFGRSLPYNNMDNQFLQYTYNDLTFILMEYMNDRGDRFVKDGIDYERFFLESALSSFSKSPFNRDTDYMLVLEDPYNFVIERRFDIINKLLRERKYTDGRSNKCIYRFFGEDGTPTVNGLLFANVVYHNEVVYPIMIEGKYTDYDILVYYSKLLKREKNKNVMYMNKIISTFENKKYRNMKFSYSCDYEKTYIESIDGEMRERERERIGEKIDYPMEERIYGDITEEETLMYKSDKSDKLVFP